ncbi:hypothetical protein ABTX62_15845 [Streptomyces sp. NPDC096046]|uniref:hypothetical protein n=1 Tax=Streptomyces sp. NPDC096046 TaxID=3155542 RepID=UPI003330FB55
MIGDGVLVGPHAHVDGAALEDEVFLATGACVSPGAVTGAGPELRITACRTSTRYFHPAPSCPSAGPRRARPGHGSSHPGEHDQLWWIREALDFLGTMYDIPRGTPMREVTARQAGFCEAHRDDPSTVRRSHCFAGLPHTLRFGSGAA